MNMVAAKTGCRVGDTVGDSVMKVSVGFRVGYLVGANVGGDGDGAAVGANVTHTFDAQDSPKQSLSRRHNFPVLHFGHDCPPQFTSVSSPFFAMSVQVAAVGEFVGDSVGNPWVHWLGSP